MRNILLAILCLLLCSGCQTGQPASALVIDPRLDPSIAELILEEAEGIFSASPSSRVPVSIGEDTGEGYFTSEVEGTCCAKIPVACAKILPFKAPVIALCVKDRPEEDLRDTIRHELIHALAGRTAHLKEKGHTMYKYSHGTELTDEDIVYLEHRTPNWEK